MHQLRINTIIYLIDLGIRKNDKKKKNDDLGIINTFKSDVTVITL